MISIIIRDRISDLTQLFVLGAGYRQLRSLILVHGFWLALASIVASSIFGISFVLILLDRLTPVYFGWKIPVIIGSEPIIRIAGLMIGLALITVYSFTKLVWKSIEKGDTIHEATQQYYLSR